MGIFHCHGCSPRCMAMLGSTFERVFQYHANLLPKIWTFSQPLSPEMLRLSLIGHDFLYHFVRVLASEIPPGHQGMGRLVFAILCNSGRGAWSDLVVAAGEDLGIVLDDHFASFLPILPVQIAHGHCGIRKHFF